MLLSTVTGSLDTLKLGKADRGEFVDGWNPNRFGVPFPRSAFHLVPRMSLGTAPFDHLVITLGTHSALRSSEVLV